MMWYLRNGITNEDKITNQCNIIWRKLKNVANNVDRVSLRAPLQNGPYKNKHLEQHETGKITRRNRQNKLLFFSFVFICIFIKLIIPIHVNLPPRYGQWLVLGVKTSFKLVNSSNGFWSVHTANKWNNRNECQVHCCKPTVIRMHINVYLNA